MKKEWFASFIVIMSLGLSACSNKDNNFIKIAAVHDGDTFTDAKNHIYRLFGVDTPEVSDQYHDFKNTKGIEGIYGFEATQLTKKLILHKDVHINKISIDKYNRSVAQIKINNKDLATELLKAGLARVSYISVDPKNPYFTNQYEYYKQLLNSQYYAAKNKIGIWRWPSRYKEIFPKSAF